MRSPLKPHILVVNSSSNDGTVELAGELGAETLVIPRASFNHGSTRELARKHLGTDVVVMMTPDAYMVDEKALEKLVAPILEGKASASYARQIAHHGADFFESFPREFNYPAEGHVRSIEDLGRYGVYTYFCSNSCAAYSNKALDEVGGFERLLLGEDTVAVAKLLKKGHKIAYAADALVHHSHRYSLAEEFRRSFDTGLARSGYAGFIDSPGGDSGRGMEYVKAMNKDLLKKAPHKIPYGLCHVLSKWVGYKIGTLSVNAPLWFKRTLSSQDFFWK
jgi:rhamnosyltransferase